MAAQSGGENPVIEVANGASDGATGVAAPLDPGVAIEPALDADAEQALAPEPTAGLPEDASRYALVETHLRKTPQEFEFFQAVRLLERLLPDRYPVGRLRTAPGKEVVRFAAHASFPFPASQIQDLVWRESSSNNSLAPVMVLNFMGIYGPSGVMPLYYTDMVIQRIRAKDPGLRDFLDLFNHRIVSL